MRQSIVFFAVVLVMVLAQSGHAAVDHSLWDTLLKRYVDEHGRVAYRELQAKDRATFDRYLALLGEARVEGMAEPEAKAFWINAYNAVIVSGVLGGHSAEGILGRKQLFSWYTVAITGQERSPDEIEHKILRKQFSDPRMHFAIVCASTSCPKLRREAYVADRLDQQLDDATRAFINDPSRNRIGPQRVALSMIFRWFAGDFVQAAGSVPDFIQRYVDDEKKRALNSHKDELQYLEYDWTLNAQKEQRQETGKKMNQTPRFREGSRSDQFNQGRRREGSQ